MAGSRGSGQRARVNSSPVSVGGPTSGVRVAIQLSRNRTTLIKNYVVEVSAGQVARAVAR